jgi:FMN phosphatase YigB (HAD superfamily)
MIELVYHLAQGYELILLSDHAIEWIEYIRSIHPFLCLFTSQFFSFELKQTKQEPSTFQKVLHTLERQPDECLIVDDSMQNLMAAAVAGMPGIQFTTAEKLMSELKSYGIHTGKVF